MRKIIVYKIIATGLLMFAGISEESKAFLKIGVSSTMTSNMGYSYGLGVKATLSETVTRLESLIASLKNIFGKLKEINGKYYEFVPRERFTGTDASLKELNSLRDAVILIRDNKRERFDKVKPIAVNPHELYAILDNVLQKVTQLSDDSETETSSNTLTFVSKTGEDKILHKGTQKAVRNYIKAKQELEIAIDSFRSAILQFGYVVCSAEFSLIPVLKLQIPLDEANKNDTIRKVEEIMAILKEFNKETNAFLNKLTETYNFAQQAFK